MVSFARGPHWKLQDAERREMRAWTVKLAKVLPALPASVATSALNSVTAIAVCMGLYGIVAPRLAEDRQLAAERRTGAVRAPQPAPPDYAGRYRHDRSATNGHAPAAPIPAEPQPIPTAADWFGGSLPDAS